MQTTIGLVKPVKTSDTLAPWAHTEQESCQSKWYVKKRSDLSWQIHALYASIEQKTENISSYRAYISHKNALIFSTTLLILS